MGKRGLREARAGKGSQDKQEPKLGLFVLARHVLCRNGVCCLPGGPHPRVLGVQEGCCSFCSLAEGHLPLLSLAQLFSTLPPNTANAMDEQQSCLLPFLPPFSHSLLAAPGNLASHLQQLQEKPAAAQPPFHSDHKPSFLSYIPLPVCIHNQTTLGQRLCKGPEVTLLLITKGRMVEQKAGGYWDGIC